MAEEKDKLIEVDEQIKIKEDLQQFVLDCGLKPEQQINTYTEFVEAVKDDTQVLEAIYVNVEVSNPSYKGIFIYKKWPSGLKNFMLHTLSNGKSDGKYKVRDNLAPYFASVYDLVQLLPTTIPLNINLYDAGDMPSWDQFNKLVTSHEGTKAIVKRINDCHGGINFIDVFFGVDMALNAFLKIWSIYHRVPVKLKTSRSGTILEGQKTLHDLNLEKRKFWDSENL